MKQEIRSANDSNNLPGQVASESGANTVAVEEEGGRPPLKAFSLLSEAEKKKLIPPGTILVEWYDDKDPALPFNWSGGKLTVVAGLILLVLYVPPNTKLTDIGFLCFSPDGSPLACTPAQVS